MVFRQQLYGKAMEYAGNLYIGAIQVLSRLKWIESPRCDTDILGQGLFCYRLDRAWCKANRLDTPVNNCHEMVIDSQQRLYLLTDHPHNNIIVLSTAGDVLNR